MFECADLESFKSQFFGACGKENWEKGMKRFTVNAIGKFLFSSAAPEFRHKILLLILFFFKQFLNFSFFFLENKVVVVRVNQ